MCSSEREHKFALRAKRRKSQTLTSQGWGGKMSDAFATGRKQKREALLDDVAKIAPVPQASGAKSEELGTLSPEAVITLRTIGMVKLKPCTKVGGSEGEPVTEMIALQRLAYLEKVFTDANVPTAAVSFFPAGRAARDGNGCRASSRWRFNSAIRQAERVPGRTVDRALMHERCERLYDSVSSGRRSDGAVIADARAICVYATDVAIETATICEHFAGNAGRHTRMSSAVCCAPSASLACTRR
jgi:hypothetical protein